MKVKAYFGGGCFWCTQAVFSSLVGVGSVRAGYAGGKKRNPKYEDLISGLTHHIETVEIAFNEEIISYKVLISVFFSTHDPTSLDRQGADVGEQYRSMIFYTNASERKAAKAFIKDLTKQKIYDKPIVTKILPFSNFYKAEKYHQNYYDKYSDNSYCRFVIDPKLEKLRTHFGKYIK